MIHDDSENSCRSAHQWSAVQKSCRRRKATRRILNRVLDHPAFGDLNSYAVHVLLLLHRRLRHPGLDKDGNRWPGNNGRIILSRVEAARDMRH